MESSQLLSIESFSYRWLVNLNPSLESLESSFRASLDPPDEASFIEMDPKMPLSKRFFITSQFDFPISQSPIALIHADELFSNGYVVPLVSEQLKFEAYNVLDSSSLNPEFLDTQNIVSSGDKHRCCLLRRCRAMSKNVLCKFFQFLDPLCRRIWGRKSGPRVSHVDDCWRRSCDSVSSIYEAVLHCKKSIGEL